MTRYAKAFVAAIPAIVMVLKCIADALGDAIVTDAEIAVLVGTVLTAIGVYAVPNRPPAGRAADPNISEQQQR